METNWDYVVISLIIFLIFTTLIAHHNLYYIEITKNEIIIKNLYFFWFRKKYKIENIQKVSKFVKNTGRGGWYGVIIHLKKPLVNYTFYMGSFKYEFLENLEKELSKLNIQFDDYT